MNNTDLRVWIKPELRLDAMFSFTKHKDDGRSFTSPLSKDELKKAAALRGKMDEDNSKSMDYSGKLMLSYNKYVYKKLYLSAMGGANVDASDSDDATYSTTGYFSDKLAHPAFASRYVDGAPTGSDGIERSVGFFVNVNTMWDEKYFLDVIYRYEGSSKFGKNKRFAPFWSVGGGWNIHKESFMKGVPVELLKLRASVGYTGNVSFSPYQAMTTYQYKGEYDYYKGIGSVPITIGNPDLTWQRTLTTNVGVDLTMFKGRWDLSLDYYIKNTDQLLLDVTKAPSIGVATARENVGSLENKGLEFQTRVIPIRTKDWYWGLSLNFSHNTNKIKKISNALQALNEKNAAATKDEDGNPILAPLPLYEEGQSLTVLKVVPSAGIDPSALEEDLGDDPVKAATYGMRNLAYIVSHLDEWVSGEDDSKRKAKLYEEIAYQGVQLHQPRDDERRRHVPLCHLRVVRQTALPRGAQGETARVRAVAAAPGTHLLRPGAAGAGAEALPHRTHLPPRAAAGCPPDDAAHQPGRTDLLRRLHVLPPGRVSRRPLSGRLRTDAARRHAERDGQGPAAALRRHAALHGPLHPYEPGGTQPARRRTGVRGLPATSLRPPVQPDPGA